jgi:hypothetical protein
VIAMTNLSFGGEVITAKAAMSLIAMIQHDAKEMAGVYHGMKRSAKFRVNWPDEDIFVESEWRSFVQAVRAMYAEKLSDPKTKPEDARKMYLALLIEKAYAEGQRAQGIEADNRLQLRPGTQQFVGDAFENCKIVETFGSAPNLRARLRSNVAKFARMH